jgi:hypothetical protein
MRLPWSQIDLRWTPHVPSLVANPTTCAAAGRHRRSRACEVHARYEAGPSPEAMSAVRQLESSHAEQLQQDGGIPTPGCPGPSNRRRTLGPAAPALPTRKVSRSPGPLPQSSAHRLPGRPRSGKTPGPPGGHKGCTPDSPRSSSRSSPLSGTGCSGRRQRRLSRYSALSSRMTCVNLAVELIRLPLVRRPLIDAQPNGKRIQHHSS